MNWYLIPKGDLILVFLHLPSLKIFPNILKGLYLVRIMQAWLTSLHAILMPIFLGGMSEGGNAQSYFTNNVVLGFIIKE